MIDRIYGFGVRALWVSGLVLAAGPCGASQQEDPDDHATCAHTKTMVRAFESGLAPAPGKDHGDSGRREALGATDVLHNALDLEIFPPTQSITGSNTMTVRSTGNGLTQFTFMLQPNFTITGITLNGTTNLTSASVGTYGRRVTFPSAFNAGDVFTLKVSYTGVPGSSGLGSITFTTQAGQPLVCTVSEPYYSATWWPCKDGDVGQPGDNSDKATFEIAVTAPAALASVSNGLLQGIDDLPDVGAGPRRRFRYATGYPMATYLACFSSGWYNTWSTQYSFPLEGGGTGSMPVDFYIFPIHDSPDHRARWEKCLGMMAAFRPLYGEYPFTAEKYGLYEFAFGGGMEHQTMTGQTGFNDWLTSHELSHQWWGDNVTCKTWNDIWLNEGFATYSEAVWYEQMPGGGAYAYHGRMSSNRPAGLSGTVYKYNISNANIIFDSDTVYNKGAWVLHMLRHYLGESTFYAGLRQYRAAFEGSAATTGDFTAVMSAVAGQDLTAFIDAWVYQAGWPSYAYGTQNLSLGGKNYLKVRVRQSQAAWMPVYPARVDVRATTPGGDVATSVINDSRTEHFVIPLGASGPASAIVLDESEWVLNSGITSEAFVAGPPVVLETDPAPGQITAPGMAPAGLSVVFSENVGASASGFVVQRVGGETIPFSLSYNAPAQRADLSLGSGTLTPGTYRLTVKATLTGTGTGLALDGEVADPVSPGALPSGNGLAGGDAVVEFTVAPCPADFNLDGFVDGIDYDLFANAFDAGEAAADYNGDGFVDGIDYDLFMNAFAAGC